MKIERRMKRGKLRWTADYKNALGERVQKLFPTREAAEEYTAKAVLEARTKTAPELPGTTTYAEMSQRALQLRAHLKPRTRRSYEDMNRRHLLPVFGATRVRDLTRQKVRAFLVGQREHFSKDTVRLMLATLRMVMAEAVEAELIQANPLAGLGRILRLGTNKGARQERTRIRAMTREQRDAFLGAAAAVRPWWAPMWTVQVLTGLRPGEVYALEERDVDLDAGTLHVARTLPDASGDEQDGESSPKGNRARVVDLSARAVETFRSCIALRKVEKLRRGWREMPAQLFCTKQGATIDPKNLRERHFKAVLKAAHLPHFTPHGLRHTFAALHLQAGTDVYYVSRMLGHADINLTVSTYGAWLHPNRPKALDALDPVVAPQMADGRA